MGTRPILYLQMGFEMCGWCEVLTKLNTVARRGRGLDGKLRRRWKIAYGFIAALRLLIT